MLDTLNPHDNERFHRLLATFNHARVAASVPDSHWEDDLRNELQFRLAEGKFLEALRAEIAPMLPSPDLTPDEFLAWFENLSETGPGQHHPLFDWLAEEATLPQMRWFLQQEAGGEAGFDDLVAYAQVKMPVRVKLECARNYWDEMGRGVESGMHGLMLDRVVRELDLQPSVDTTVWQALALSNTMLGLATNRRYAYHALGALGAIELTAPGRVRKVADGMKRLGLGNRTRAYFELHASLDVAHSREWNSEVIRPLVESDPACARALAEGALMRLVCGQRCFERYSLELHRRQAALEC